MVADYSSHVVIGCEIDKSKLYTSTKVRACYCIVDGIEDANFCLNCGKPVWKDGLAVVEGYDESQGTLFGFDIVYGTDHERCWIAIRKAEAEDDHDAVKLEDVEQISLSELKEMLKAAIGPAGFWDEKKFGIWVINYCSY